MTQVLAAAHATQRWARNRRLFVDGLFAALVAVMAIAEVASESVEGERDADLVAYALVLVGAVTLVWRRRAPIVVLTLVTAVLVIFWVRGYPSLLATLGLPSLYAAAAHCADQRRAWIAIVGASVALFVAASLTTLDTAEGFDAYRAMSMAAFLAAASGAGVVVRNRERIFVDTQHRAERAEADRFAEAQRAVARERSRIAREMHDVVAHSMSVVVVQAAAAQEIARSNPDKAVEVMAKIEAIGRESLTEMRRMLGVLRDGDDDTATLTPQPTMNDLSAVIAQCTEAGIPTELVVSGKKRELPGGVDLAGFRIVQEALTNVLKHAGQRASATVHIDYGEDSLSIEVTDDGRGAASTLSKSGSGNGLIGMRERVEIYEGEFSSGPTTGGGYQVRALLPIDNRGTRPAVFSPHDQLAEPGP